MLSLRRLALTNRNFAGLALAIALALKILVPSGFMPSVSNGQMVISLCSGAGATNIVVPMPGVGDHSQDEGHPGKQAEQTCAFAALSAPSLAAVDPLLLAVAILFVLALGMRFTAPETSTVPPFLRPPLRGPPAVI